MGKFSFIQVCSTNSLHFVKFNMIFCDIVLSEVACRFYYDRGSFVIILGLHKASIFLFKFNEIKIKLLRKEDMLLQLFCSFLKNSSDIFLTWCRDCTNWLNTIMSLHSPSPTLPELQVRGNTECMIT